LRYVVRIWDCSACGRSNQNLGEPDGRVTCEYCRRETALSPSASWGTDRSARFEPFIDDEMRESLQKLRAHYAAARPLGSPHEAHANLEWVLGTRRGPGGGASSFKAKSVEVASLWLEDLASELDRLTAPPTAVTLAGPHDELGEWRRSTARRLRDATERFLLAFRSVAARNQSLGSDLAVATRED
jgi:hypothetical protein